MATGGGFYENLYNPGRPARSTGAPRPTSEQTAVAAIVRAGPMQVLTAGGPRPTKSDEMARRGIRGVAVMTPDGTYTPTVPAGGGYDLATPYTMPGGGSSSKGDPVAGNFIKGAIKRPGALSRKARAAGQSVDAFARANEHAAGLTGQQSRFYLGVLKSASRAPRKSSSRR